MGRSKFTLALLLVAFAGTSVQAGGHCSNVLTLEQALQKKLVSAEITASSGHYGKCIRMKLKNTSNQALTVTLEAGRRLNCDYDSVQDMMITQSEMFALLPVQKQEYTIYAMCCEKSDRSPSVSSTYLLGAMADHRLVRLAQLIEKLGAQDNTGQQAVWVLTDKRDPNSIYGSDEAVVKALKELVITLSRIPEPPETGVIYDYSYPKSEGNAFTLEGDFLWELGSPGFVSLYIYDNSGNRVHVIFQDAAFSSGLQRYHYKVTSEKLASGELYWIRMKQNNRTLKELAVKMD